MSDREILFDLFGVGWTKPMGYLPLSTIEFHGWTPGLVMAWAKNNNHDSELFDEEASRVLSGALYVWHAPALQALLDANTFILNACEWPNNANAFARRVARQTVFEEEQPSLYSLIGRAFSDPRFTVSRYVIDAVCQQNTPNTDAAENENG